MVVCVAQVRPTTAPTAYLDDQVGRIVGGPEVGAPGGRPPAGPDLAGGRPGLVRRRAGPARGDPGAAAHRRRGGRRGDRRGRPGHQPLHRADPEPARTELPDHRRRPGPDGRRRHLPAARHPGETTSAPRVGDGLVRLDANGKVTYASPNAQSAYRRLGYASHLVGEDLAELHRRLAGDPLEGTDAGNAVLAALRGEAPPRREIDARGATMLHPGAAADAGRRADRRAGAGPRHHRGTPARPGPDHQGRHHPGDPPPGEEQPADGRRAAAPPGPPGGHAGGPGRAGGVGTPGGLDRAGARDALHVQRRGGRVRRHRGPGGQRGDRGGRHRGDGRHAPARAASAYCPPRSPPRW